MLTAQEQIASYRLFKAFTQSGLPAEKAAAACASQQKRARAQWLRVKATVQTGERLSVAMAGADLWPPGTLAAIQAGEASGQLTKVFAELMTLTEQEDRLRRMARSSLIQPVIYMVFAVGLLYAFMLVMYPRITGGNTGSSRDGLMFILDGIRAMFVVSAGPVAMAVAALIGVVIAARFMPGVSLWIDQMMDRLPLWGQGNRCIAAAYWSRLFAMLDATGSLHDERSMAIATAALKDVHRAPFKRLMSEYQASGSLALAADSERWNRSDPRRSWPVLFASALFSGASAGTLSESLPDASQGLIEEGEAGIKSAVARANLVGLIMAGTSAACVMLLMTLTTVANVMAAF